MFSIVNTPNIEVWYLWRKQVGRYEYKFIVDGNWVTNPELPLSQPNREGQVNNYLEVQLLSSFECATRTIILNLQNS